MLFFRVDFGRIRLWWVCGWEGGLARRGVGWERSRGTAWWTMQGYTGAEVQRCRGAEAAAGQSIAKEGLAWVLAVGARGGVVGLL